MVEESNQLPAIPDGREIISVWIERRIEINQVKQAGVHPSHHVTGCPQKIEFCLASLV